MNRRHVLAALAAGALFVPASVLAQANAWNGTWVGTTPSGRSIQIAVAGNGVTYAFGGQPANITGVRMSGNAMTISVHGGVPSTVQLTKGKGNTATYVYTQPGSPPLQVTLTKQ